MKSNILKGFVVVLYSAQSLQWEMLAPNNL